MKKITIYINDCIRWSGGLNILIQAISALNKNELLETEIIFVKPNIQTKVIDFLRLLLRGGNFKENRKIGEDLFRNFYSYLEENKLKLEEYTFKEFKNSTSYNYVFPVMKINNSLKNKNLIGYIPDCQHLYLSQLFLKRVILYRNFQFRRVNKYCKKIIATSAAVKNDLINYYNFSEKKIITFRFNPIRLEEKINFKKPDESNYFLIANQLWEHKNHDFAFIAFSKFLIRHPNSSAKLFCTGYLQDYRNSSHSQKLKNLISELNLDDRVEFLGYLKREDFLNYLIYSNALIQPSLFEGTPGGLSTADAISYGVEVLLSNIDVNLEVNIGNYNFFDLNDVDSLVNLLSRNFNVNINERLKLSEDISVSSIHNYGELIYKNI